jgi:hypothetical protein
MMAFEDNDLVPQERQLIMLANLYPKIPANLEEAMSKAMWFLGCGKEEDDRDNPMRLFGWSHDAAYIFAAFRQTHGIDLETADMHWWKFIALFMDLGSETTFSNLVGLRKKLKTGKASKDERAAAAEMQSVIQLPEIDTRTLDEKDAQHIFETQVKAAMQKRKAEREKAKTNTPTV